jgi:hypothetical protein
VNALSVQFLRQFHDADCVVGTFPDADSAACTEVFIYDRFFLSCYEFDCVSSVQDFWAESVAWNAAIIWFAMLFVEYGYS